MQTGEITLAALGLLLLLQGILPLRTGRLTYGLLLCLASGVVCFAFAFLPTRSVMPFPVGFGFIGDFGRHMRRPFFSLSPFFCRYAELKILCDTTRVPPSCWAHRVHRGRLSAMIKSRLNGALAYAKKNPKALIVLSGGKGRGEDVSEADAMAKYLLSRGLDKRRMLIENRSTNTRENFLYSKGAVVRTFGPTRRRSCLLPAGFMCSAPRTRRKWRESQPAA